MLGHVVKGFESQNEDCGLPLGSTEGSLPIWTREFRLALCLQRTNLEISERLRPRSSGR